MPQAPHESGFYYVLILLQAPYGTGRSRQISTSPGAATKGRFRGSVHIDRPWRLDSVSGIHSQPSRRSAPTLDTLLSSLESPTFPHRMASFKYSNAIATVVCNGVLKVFECYRNCCS